MIQIVSVGIGAGVAASLLFASVASGSILATLLFYLAPLPILIAGLGWSHWAGMVAAITAALGLGAILEFYLFVTFLIGVGLPAWWLGYLTLLTRPVAASGNGAGPAGVEWYPLGRLVLWAALIGAIIVLVAVPNFGTDKESFQVGLRGAFERAIRTQVPTGAPSPSGRQDVDRLIDILVLAIPPAAAVLATLINVFNLWLAGRIVKVSGRLRRPWPDLAELQLPGFAAGLLAAAIAGSLLPDLIGILASVLAASLLMAYAIQGFAVLHAITRGMKNRGFALGGAYATVTVFGWPVLGMSLLGLADTLFNVRARFATKRGPPTLRT
jgi:AcrR family transcriptional regulator